jgi:peroxiredoxin
MTDDRKTHEGREGALIPAALFLAVALIWAVGCGGSKHEGDSPEDVAKATLTQVGQVAPDFTVTTLDGKTFTLSEMRGRTVLLNFFATWCPPCKEEVPHLQEIWEKLGTSGQIVMLSIAREETPTEVLPFREKYGLTFPMACDPEREIFARYATGYIPRTYVIFRDGVIRYQTQGFDEKEFFEIEKLLAEKGAP